MTAFFESHAHYDDPRFDADRETLLKALPSMGVTHIINIGADMASSQASVALAEAFSHVYATVGVHPHEAKTLTDEKLSELATYCSHDKVVAVGEIGLDFHYDNSPRDTQRHWFREQLAMAKELEKPVVIHSREAAAETFDIIKESGLQRGVVHCFSGSAELALQYIQLGFYIGVDGPITFDKTRKLAEVVSRIPLNRLLIETDAPYLSPVPNRGKRNDSGNLVYIAEAIGRIRGISTEAVAEATFANALALFEGVLHD